MMNTYKERDLKLLYNSFIQKKDIESASKVLDLIEKQQNNQYNLSFAGHFSAGKSSMINYLMDMEVLPKSPIPTSANIVEVTSGEGVARVYFNNETTLEYDEPYNIDLIQDYCMNRDTIKKLEISTSESVLPQGSAIIDTPGIDAANDADRLMTESSLHLVDTLFYVTDYNHVQSEVNLYFLREIQDMDIPFYVIVNQIDKHNENEISFTKFESSVKETFRQWNVKPERFLYSSILNPEAAHSQLSEIKEVIFTLLNEKPKSDERIKIATDQIMKEHRLFLERENEELILKNLSNEIEEDLLLSFIDLTQEEAELEEKLERLDRDFKNEVELTLKNAYLMPAQLREYAKHYLESLEPNFKVGFIGSKKKTEEERKARLNKFLNETQAQIDKTVLWSIKERILEFFEINEIKDDDLIQAVDQISVVYTEENLRSFIKKGAQINGQYVLNYTNEINAHIKQLFRIQTNELFNRIKNYYTSQLKEEKESATKDHQAAYQIYEKESDYLINQLDLHLKSILKFNEQALTDEIESLITNEIAKRKIVEKDEAPPEKQPEKKTKVNQAAILEEKELEEGQTKSLETVTAAIDETLDVIQDLPGFEKILAELKDKKKRLENRELTIALFGAFSAGKSSFSNALFGEQILPVSPNPTTAVINRISPISKKYPHGTVMITLKNEEALINDILNMTSEFSPKNLNFHEYINWIKQEKVYDHYALNKSYQSYLRAMVRGYDARKSDLGGILEIGLDEFAAFLVDEEKACYIEVVDLYYDSPITRKGITIVDTPGANSVNARHTNVAFDYIKYADAILYVTYYNHAVSSADRDFLIQLGRVKEAFEMDKMFFIVNAADLAESEADLNLVLEYVEGELLELGIRFPRIYPVSSKLSLEDKLANQALNEQMKKFEDEFYHFIEYDLAQLTIDSVVWDIKRSYDTLKNYIDMTAMTDEEQGKYLKELESEREETLESVQAFNYDLYHSRLTQRIERQLHFVKERLGIRFHDMFTQFFNPTTITQNGRKAIQELEASRSKLIDYAGYELLQEIRAVSLRVEHYANQLLSELYDQIQANLKAQNEIYLLSSHHYFEFITPEYIQAFKNINLDRFNDALKIFKNQRSFFEQNEREQMKDEFYQALVPEVDAYVNEQEVLMHDAYNAQWNDFVEEIQTRIMADVKDIVFNQIKLVTETIDLDNLIKRKDTMKNIIEKL